MRWIIGGNAAQGVQLQQTGRCETRWLADVLNREGKRLGTTVDLGENNVLALQWKHLGVHTL